MTIGCIPGYIEVGIADRVAVSGMLHAIMELGDHRVVAVGVSEPAFGPVPRSSGSSTTR